MKSAENSAQSTICIQADDDLLAGLTQIAKDRSATIEAIVRDVLKQYLRKQTSSSKRYSFIGIGHSGKKDISIRAEEILENAVSRSEGWSLPE